jgi:hypothetical protein
MTDRSAVATIKGYLYQFDKTILEILRLDDEGYVTVEGLEDVDVTTMAGTTAIQCKYYAAQKYSPAGARVAVIAMLDDFLERDATTSYVDYYLYGYFNDVSKMPDALDLEYLQKMLRWKTRKPSAERDYQVENNISDDQLQRFLTHFRMQSGASFEEQQDSVMKAVQKAYDCSREEAELHFYSNALHKVLILASEMNVATRVISKAQFMSDTKKARTLFNVWFRRWRGKEAYLFTLKKQLKSCNALYGLKDKWLFLDENSVSLDSADFDLVALISSLVEKYYKLGTTNHKHKPWTVVTSGSVEEIRAVKRILVRRGILFNDGMESIEFSSAVFNEPPVVSIKNQKCRIDRASYQVRILAAETLRANRNNLDPLPEMVLFVSRDLEPGEFFGVQSGMQLHHLAYIDQLKDVAGLIL